MHMTSESGQAPPRPAKRFGARQVDQPRSGYFLLRLVKGGPRVPCAISVDFGMASCSIDGRPYSSPTAEPHGDRRLMEIWTYGEEIDRAEYERLLRAPDRPDPFTAIDLTARPPLF